MSQQDIIDHFVLNGNKWETLESLRNKINRSVDQCVHRMASIMERRFIGPHRKVEFRLKPDHYEKMIKERSCEKL